MSDANKPDPFDLSVGVPAIEGSLRPTPKFADRISKRVLIVAFCGVMLVFGIFMVSLDKMDRKKARPPAPEKTATKKTDAESTVPKELRGSVEADIGTSVARASLVNQSPPALPEPAASAPVKPQQPKGQVPAIGGMAGGSLIPNEVPANGVVVPLTPAQQAENAAVHARVTRMNTARMTGLSAKPFASEEKAPGTAVNAEIASLLASAKAGGAGQQAASSSNSPRVDSEQDEKLDFIKSAAKDDRGYHTHIPQPAISPNEIKTGSFIPMTLEQGINSDLPGQITARVTEDVYDSVTGCLLLIPAMAKGVGKYDSKIALGQGRMLVAWNSMVFPDGAELNLGGIQGYDTSGAAGLESDVDNHYWRLFGLTFGLSMITAGVQSSVPQQTNNTNTPTTGQTIATALAQQYGNLGSQIIGKYMAVQPTLRNFAGERFVLMVPRTIVFKKVWRNRCAAGR